jgi:hypothetical protein
MQSSLRDESGRVDELVSLDHQLAQRGVINNPHTTADATALKLEYDAVLGLAAQQISTLEKELAKAQAATGVDPEQMAEFKEMCVVCWCSVVCVDRLLAVVLIIAIVSYLVFFLQVCAL